MKRKLLCLLLGAVTLLLCAGLGYLLRPYRFADLLPKRRNAKNLTPLYGFGAFSFDMSGFFSGGILTVRHSQVAVCHFRVTKKRRISTTLLFCSEDGARERYSIICCTFSFC